MRKLQNYGDSFSKSSSICQTVGHKLFLSHLYFFKHTLLLLNAIIYIENESKIMFSYNFLTRVQILANAYTRYLV